MTNTKNTVSADTNHLDKFNAFLADKVALDLIDQGFSHVWLAGQTPDDFSGKVQLVFAGTKWVVGKKSRTEKPDLRFVTSIGFGDSDHDPVKKVRFSNNARPSSLPFKMAVSIVKQFSKRIVFVVAK
jgi:hypothetical protein